MSPPSARARVLAVALVGLAGVGHAANYSQLWLTYTPLSPSMIAALNYTHLVCGSGGNASAGAAPRAAAPLDVACDELQAGLGAMMGANLTLGAGPRAPGGRAVVVSVAGALAPAWPPQPALDAYAISVGADGTTTVSSASATGALYGAWRLLSLAQRESPALLAPGVAEASAPGAALRVWNLWDNLDGSVERGYAGASILYPLARADARRVRDYARLLASVGINALVVDNVNACGAGNAALLASANLAALAPLAAAFYAVGIHVLLTPCWTSPAGVGGLNSSDPRDARVAAWWARKALEAAAVLPAGAFRGFLFKGDTEGQPGPADDNMTELEGANALARLVAPAGAVVVWRAFSHPPGGRDLPVDQALFQFQRFAGWDGATEPNVVLQTKNGPFDFQVREPVHALFGALPRVNVILELEVTLEYLGQNRHALALPPQWASYLGFDLGAPPPRARAAAADTTLAGVVSRGALSGIAGVSNLGASADWAGSPLSTANTFGFGRLAWAPAAPAAAPLEEWARLCFARSAPGAPEALVALLADTWAAYENFTASLGWGFAAGGDHYEMDPAARVDYTNASATRVGYARGAPGAYGSMYNAAQAAAFTSLDDCPEELLLAFHNVPYGHALRGARYGGLSVLEWIRASHAAGAAASAGFARQWAALEGRLNVSAFAVAGQTEADVFAAVAATLAAAATDAARFADTVVGYFDNLTAGAGSA
jgi:alpha-glucuronidase